MKILKQWMTNPTYKLVLTASFFLGLLFFTPAVYAQAEVRVSVPIEQTFQSSGALDLSEQTGVYLLEPNEVGNPMPDGTAPYQVRLAGNESSEIVFTFSETGIFSYNVYQQIPAVKEGFVYDQEVYTITVYVDAARAEVIVKNREKLKTVALTFVNRYTETPKATEDQPSKQNESKDSSLPSTGELVDNRQIWLGLIVLAASALIYWKRSVWRTE